MRPTFATLSRRTALHIATLAVLFMAAIASLTTLASAQSSSSSVNGVVSDQLGAIVSETKVTLKNVDTNVVRVTVTNGSGAYVFTAIPPARSAVHSSSQKSGSPCAAAPSSLIRATTRSSPVCSA